MMQGKQHKAPIQHEENLVTQLLSKYITYWPAFFAFIVLVCCGRVCISPLRYPNV